ncbi:MAG TPA: FHA domain-containing protein [Acidimicrobiales bacterium]
MGAYLEVWVAHRAELLPLDGDRPVVVGRANSNDVVLSSDSTVSRVHAAIVRYASGWCVRDLGSANGTFINGQRIAGERAVQPGDEILVGSSRLVLRGDSPLSGRETLAPERPPNLTGRERDVLIALCRSLLSGAEFAQPASVREIAQELVVSEAAVKSHLLNLYDKFGIDTSAGSRRVRLAQEALRMRAVTAHDVQTNR